MYNELDLHNLDFKVALSVFKKKYNEALKKKDRREILVIHGYGANNLDPFLCDKLTITVNIDNNYMKISQE